MRTSFISMTRRLVWVLLAMSAVLAWPLARAQEEAADAFIKRISTETLDMVKADKSLRNGDTNKIIPRLVLQNPRISEDEILMLSKDRNTEDEVLRMIAESREWTKIYAALAPQVAGIRRFGAASLDLAWVAAGRYDGFWESGLAPWDTAAGCLLVREAGGFVSDWRGVSQPICDTQVLAANDVLHSKLHKSLVSALK